MNANALNATQYTHTHTRTVEYNIEHKFNVIKFFFFMCGNKQVTFIHTILWCSKKREIAHMSSIYAYCIRYGIIAYDVYTYTHTMRTFTLHIFVLKRTMIFF